MIMTISFYTNHVHFRRSELQIRHIELRAMAAAAIHGCRATPTGVRAPAAIGMPMKLYSTAQRKLDLIFRTVFLDSSIAEITSSKLFCEGSKDSCKRSVQTNVAQYMHQT